MSATHTRAEIEVAPDAWQRTIDCWHAARLDLARYRDLLFVGCGSSYFMAELGAQAFRATTGARVAAALGSDVMLAPEIFLPGNGPSLAVLVSRSGRTWETVEAARALARLGHDTLALTCSADNELARRCQRAIALPGTAEQSIVATASVSSSALLLLLLAASCARQAANKRMSLLAQLHRLPRAGDALLRSPQRRALERFVGRWHTRATRGRDAAPYVAFLGLGVRLTVARETAMKLKEMALLPSDPEQTLEFRHGPRALVEDGSLVVLFGSTEHAAVELAVLREARELGARTVRVCGQSSVRRSQAADLVYPVGMARHGLARIPLELCLGQLLGLAVAVARGIDPDQPRNLQYFVTASAR